MFPSAFISLRVKINSERKGARVPEYWMVLNMPVAVRKDSIYYRCIEETNEPQLFKKWSSTLQDFGIHKILKKETVLWYASARLSLSIQITHYIIF